MLDCMEMRKERGRFLNLSKYIIWPERTISVRRVVNTSRENISTWSCFAVQIYNHL